MDEPQLACELYAHWIHGIFDALTYSIRIEHPDLQLTIPGKRIDWSGLSKLDEEIYHKYLTKFKTCLIDLVKRNNGETERKKFVAKANEILFSLCCRDMNILVNEDAYYYEPITSFFGEHFLGLKFYSDLVNVLGWTKEAGKCIINIALISDPRTIDEAIRLCIDDFKFSKFRSLTYVYEVLREILNSLSARDYQLYLEFRLRTFGWLQMGDIDLSLIDLPFDSRSMKPIRFSEGMKDSILFMAYIDPLWVGHRIIGEGILNRPQMIPWLARLCCEELAPLCMAIGPEENSLGAGLREPVNFIVQLLNSRLRTFSTHENFEASMKFLVEVFSYYSSQNSSKKPILTLEKVVKCFVEEGSVDEDTTVWMKVKFIKLIRGLCEIRSEEWTDFQRVPAPTVYHLLEFLDFFFLDGSKKRAVIELLDYLLKKKLKRKLTKDEVKWIHQNILKHSSCELLVCYLVPHSEITLGEIYNLHCLDPVDIVTISAVLGPTCEVISTLDYQIKAISVAKESVRGALRFMETKEYINFYMVLTHVKSPGAVVQLLVEAAMDQSPTFGKVNADYVLSSMIILGRHAIEDVREGHVDRYGRRVYGDTKKKNFTQFLLKLFREFTMFYIGKDFIGHVSNELMSFLIDIARELKNLSVDPKILLNGRVEMHYLAKKALEQVFGPLTRDSPPPFRLIHIPG